MALAALLLQMQTAAMVVILYLALLHPLAAVVVAHQRKLALMQVLMVVQAVAAAFVIPLLAVLVAQEIRHQHHQAKEITEAQEIPSLATTIHKSMLAGAVEQLEQALLVLTLALEMVVLAQLHRFPVHQLLTQAVVAVALLISLLGLVALVVEVLALKQHQQQVQYLEPRIQVAAVVAARKIMLVPQELAALAS